MTNAPQGLAAVIENLTVKNTLKVDTISEYTSDNGVSVDSAPVKDGNFDGVDISTLSLSKSYRISSNTALLSSDAEVNGGSGTYQLEKSLTLATGPKTRVLMRVVFDLKSSAGAIQYGRVYRNGIALGTEQSTTSTSYVTKSEDLYFMQGDTCELWLKETNAESSDARNFRIMGDETTNASLIEAFTYSGNEADPVA